MKLYCISTFSRESDKRFSELHAYSYQSLCKETVGVTPTTLIPSTFSCVSYEHSQLKRIIDSVQSVHKLDVTTAILIKFWATRIVLPNDFLSKCKDLGDNEYKPAVVPVYMDHLRKSYAFGLVGIPNDKTGKAAATEHWLHAGVWSTENDLSLIAANIVSMQVQKTLRDLRTQFDTDINLEIVIREY